MLIGDILRIANKEKVVTSSFIKTELEKDVMSISELLRRLKSKGMLEVLGRIEGRGGWFMYQYRITEFGEKVDKMGYENYHIKNALSNTLLYAGKKKEKIEVV